MKKLVPGQWLGRDILDQDHIHGLERDAALNEFGHKMPRDKAEEKAYEDYVRNKRIAAASHHYRGNKAALSVGDMDSARKHHVMYELHLKALGMDPHGPVPPAVMNHVEEEPMKLYRFKPHHGDAFAIADAQEHSGESHGSSPESVPHPGSE